MSCENPLRIPNPRYASCIGAVNYEASKSYDGVTIQDYCESLFGYRGRPPDEFIDVPCGKCFSCHKSRLNGWRIRLLSEVNRYPDSVFITLTFNDYYLEHFKDDPNKSLRLFLDRIRKKYGKQVRHFFIPEFGDKTKRLHYHGILFNVPYKSIDPEVMAKEWKYGFIFLGWCNTKTCNYIVKYITKDAPVGQKLPRIVASKGIGETYVSLNGATHLMNERPYIMYGKFRVPLPRYYLTKIFTENERLYLQEKQRLEPFKRFVNGIEYNDELEYKTALKSFYKHQISLGLSSRPVKPSRHLESFVFKNVQFKYLTPWDDDDISDRFDISVMDDFCLVHQYDNVYFKQLTPF